MTVADNSDLISSYAARLNPALLHNHAVISPLGVWLLLALVGPATTGQARRDLETVLGTTVADAQARAQLLLEEPHPAVSAIAAAWDRDLGPAFDQWARTLPGAVERGPVPDQLHANAWAQQRTNGAITEFPLRIDDLTRFILASALATDISWAKPLGTSTELGGEFGAHIGRALVVDDGVQLVADTAAAGLVAVTAPPTSSALDVFSVIAAPDVGAERVDRAAHQVAAMLRGDTAEARVIPTDQLTDGHAWTVTERRVRGFGGSSVEIRWRSHQPAWSASSSHDLDYAPGMPEVFSTLAGFARPEDQPALLAAKQTAVASYGREGFTAAAVTAIAMAPGSMPTVREVLVRCIDVRFNRPYAVLATAAKDQGPIAWRGVPLFSAWITKPDDTAVEAPHHPSPSGSDDRDLSWRIVDHGQ